MMCQFKRYDISRFPSTFSLFLATEGSFYTKEVEETEKAEEDKEEMEGWQEEKEKERN